MRTAKAAISGRVGVRPRGWRLLPACFRSIRFRCHVNRVSGAAMVATCSNVFRPSFFALAANRPSLVIVELQTPITHLLPKDAILLDQICDNLLLMSAHPSSDGQHHN